MNVTLLGTGSSAGVPEIGCHCAVCCSKNPRNRRTRVSILVETGSANILIDTSPDLYQQALREGISRVDAVLYTHFHADHTAGIDDLRAFCRLNDAPLDVYADAATFKDLTHRFSYVFSDKPAHAWYRPALTPHVITEDMQAFTAGGGQNSAVYSTAWQLPLPWASVSVILPIPRM